MEHIGGYRLVRLLARGTHADVWLGASDADTERVAIKLFHASTPVGLIDLEVEALARVSHRHAQRLIDISVDPQGRACLVLERLGPSLSRVLADRTALAVGEAVTVLAPVSLAVAELHRVGVAHGRIDAGSVLFDVSGAPVLAGFGSAALVGDAPHPPRLSGLTPVEAAANESLAADREALARLAQHVLSRVDGDRSVGSWVRQLPTYPPSFPEELAERLFSAGPAVPLALGSPIGAESASALTVRDTFRLDEATPNSGAQDAAAGPAAASGDGDPLPFAVTALLPPWLDSWIGRMRTEWLGDVSPGDLAARAANLFATVRKRTLIAAIGGLAALAAAIIVVVAEPAPGIDTDSAATEAAAPPTADEATEPHSSRWRPDVSPEPLAAAGELLERRERCLRDLSLACLNEAHQPRSAAMDADTHRIRQRQHDHAAPPAIDWSSAELELIDELGDGALIAATIEADGAAASTVPVTATLLLVRTGDGWRIRDLIE